MRWLIKVMRDHSDKWSHNCDVFHSSQCGRWCRAKLAVDGKTGKNWKTIGKKLGKKWESEWRINWWAVRSLWWVEQLFLLLLLFCLLISHSSEALSPSVSYSSKYFELIINNATNRFTPAKVLRQPHSAYSVPPPYAVAVLSACTTTATWGYYYC